MTAPARAAAHRVLRDVHTSRADLPRAQARAREGLADARDRALAAEIAIGTLRWQAALDAIIEQVSSRPLAALDGDILDLLRAAVYQLLYLERVPSHAVVHDAVSLSRAVGKRSAAGFVNAVLRAVTARAPGFSLPERPSYGGAVADVLDRQGFLDYISITLSHPRWLVERWVNRYGPDAAERWAHFNNEPAPITLRVNTLKTSADTLATRLATHDVQVRPGRWSSSTLVVVHGNPLATPVAEQGLCLVQDEASQLVAELVAARPGTRVLDACASPGGKTIAIAGMMTDRGLLVAGDLRPRRLSLLSQTLTRCSIRCAQVVRLDLRQPPFAPVFDCVLLDVPCSGLGTLRRDPDIRWRCTPEELSSLAATQLAFLRAAAAVVSPGGRLVYATCSGEPEENQQVVERFLADNSGFGQDRSYPEHLTPLIDSDGHLRTLPFRDDLEAFFATVLRRRKP